MAESEFIRLAEEAPQELGGRMEASGIDADCEFKGTGLLEVGRGGESGGGSGLIARLPRQTPG
jgi:frataxin-like iron-binding protein CyaY